MSRSRQRKTVIICGELHNLGDLMLLLQNLALREEAAPATVWRWAPVPDNIARQVAAAGGELFDGHKFLSFTWRCRGAHMVIGGGQIVRENVSLPSLVGLWLAVLAAWLGGGMVETRGLGVSRIRSGARKALWRMILRLSRIIHVRDAASAANIAALDKALDTTQTADMVFVPTTANARLTPSDEIRQNIVVAPCFDPNENRSIDGEATGLLLQRVAAMFPEHAIVVACHDLVLDDGIADGLIADYPQIDMVKFNRPDLFELVDLYRSARLVITNRLHSLIFSVLTDTPVISIDDGNGKLRAVSTNFAIPAVANLPMSAEPSAIDAAIGSALDFDRAARGALRDTMRAAAERNLSSI